ncbi:MAG: twin-arginine translocase TatA/TatE family subunit [Bacteroidetes bacterium]|nr:twin-arginine translocase TatA/TatE family subunit [Bacteroidota bacterium]
MFNFQLLFFDISTGEIMIILLMVFLVFGPGKIPELSKKIGRGIYEIKRASNEIKREIDTEIRKMERDIDQPLKETTPNKKTIDSNKNQEKEKAKSK